MTHAKKAKLASKMRVLAEKRKKKDHKNYRGVFDSAEWQRRKEARLKKQLKQRL